ncbi:hypothetical protein GCM10018793_52130 [Streptomyces sulfonofaciens]|uniref:Uncharacterized protein n=1 Tax=Streptomyces sulfonofaciens TaxID=68272 RepID=A0A919GIR5_9ACTN|nr:hypothetical protein [Streptomyces sulfonofaciens]GHH85172.1 hypothetical protein GCM10018793_52130 [Streptomyces sulfonofaciens]
MTFDWRRRRPVVLRSRRERIVRGTLLTGVVVLALLAVLSMVGTSAPKDTAGRTAATGPRHPRLLVPAGYDTSRGWDVSGVSDEYVVAENTGSVAVLEEAGQGRFQVRALDVTSGRTRWTGDPVRPLSRSWARPRLLTVSEGSREYFVTWSYGDIGQSVLGGPRTVVSLDIYDAAYGTRQHVYVPWPEAPDVTAGGPGILIGRGSDHAAVVDPADGKVSTTAAKDLKYPRGCGSCHRDTDIRGLTSHGLIVRGAKEFWVRGGWYGRRTAPKGTDPASGVPASVSTDRVLVKWRRKPGGKKAGDFETWAVHDAATGKVLASADCHRPAVDPGRYPEMVFSFSGRYVVAGALVFDLADHKGYCFDKESDGTTQGAVPGEPSPDVQPDDPAADKAPRPLTLIAVTDQGTAYGTTGMHTAADARSGLGKPLRVSLSTAVPELLVPTVHLPAADLGGYGLFPYTDSKGVQHLIGYPRRGTAD